MAHVYTLQEKAALFFENENLVHVEHFAVNILFIN
jgi:hypothetical protein